MLPSEGRVGAAYENIVASSMADLWSAGALVRRARETH